MGERTPGRHLPVHPGVELRTLRLSVPLPLLKLGSAPAVHLMLEPEPKRKSGAAGSKVRELTA